MGGNEILVSRDWPRVLGFLGLDAAAYGDFQTLEEIFRFVRSSSYFHPDIYLLQNRNHVSRIRDKKRKTYMLFLEWCEQQPVSAPFVFGEKDSYLERIVAQWPHLRQDIDAANAEAMRIRDFRSRFNGERVARLCGKTGKALGEQMQHSRNGYSGPGDFVSFVLAATDAELDACIRGTLISG
ncbi:hypothetical protein D0B54_15395 [Solimonas sp. K1W22B-7]|uniref:hypothetical protein n=1 Tax=Solimonas sp. K1W22B-7 TaxID=2303331 RepID=UPI000E333442|nr:hypothetical protein [Solimonas sp. K1W22B-7]AXQ29975.1 hypothetical protein D0B54_15395 [Solimonas sp. K1W22B-7]